MEHDLTRANLLIEDYLNHIKKTREELITEWTPAAEKKAKLQLVLNEIAKKEEVVPDAAAVEHELEHILSMYKDANQERARIYIESVLRNEAVMKMLETIA
jgi:FKBP-type peptidyl-prolyl cis-trans isomerase (trigger factor)